MKGYLTYQNNAREYEENICPTMAADKCRGAESRAWRHGRIEFMPFSGRCAREARCLLIVYDMAA